MVGTNFPSADGLPHLFVVHTLRVDLTDPDIKLRTTPPAQNFIPDGNETGAATVSDFLAANHLQVAINANRFDPEQYYLAAGTSMNIHGLSIDQGVVVSAQDGKADAATLLFDEQNHASIVFTNWPAAGTSDVFTAVSGTYPILIDGKDIARDYVNLPNFIHDYNPRTVFGLSADRRYLYLMAIDGRQGAYSQGAWDYEAAEWLILAGASDGVNMDGGGSTTLVIEDTTGFPVRLNSSSAVADSGKERSLGSHFGLNAKRLRGFVNDLVVVPEDTSATIQWTTAEPSSTEVRYDTSTALSQSTAADPSLATQHTVRLTSLTPWTGYYFQILSSTTSNQLSSSLYYFVTTNYVTTNQVFDLAQNWVFTAQPASDLAWTLPSYDTSNWSGPGAGLFWLDVRPTGPNPNISPLGTQLPANPATRYPYGAYYFRTHFTVSNLVANSWLLMDTQIDDGAIFYLNGKEIARFRMPEGSSTAGTLAKGYPCEGDATCVEKLMAPGTALVEGDNVLAVEVHNYDARSPDLTFGITLALQTPVTRAATLEAQYRNSQLTLSWTGSGLVLQAAGRVDGPWADVPGAAQSPFTASTASGLRFYRLQQKAP